MRHQKWFWGVFFILSAVFVIASQVTDFMKIGLWSILGAILLLAVMIHSVAHRNFFGIFVPLVLLYGIFWQPLGLIHISIWVLLAAAVLASIGFHFIFRNRPPQWWKSEENGGRFHATTESSDDNNPQAKVSFGASTKYLHSTALQTGQFDVSFGSLEVYLDQAQLSPDGAELYVNCRFGAIELYVPRSWRVKGNVQASLGAAEINEHRSDAAIDAPLLLITGNVSFGAVEVKYI